MLLLQLELQEEEAQTLCDDVEGAKARTASHTKNNHAGNKGGAIFLLMFDAVQQQS
jgi:hypothetical protein